MANTDTRSGFRLPWSQDRSHENSAAEDAAPAAEEATEEVAEETALAWPSTDFNARLGLTSQPRPAGPTVAPIEPAPASDAQEPAMIELEPSPAPAPVAPPRKPTKLMADLTTAIRSTAIAARDQALAQVDTDVAKVIETIRSGSKEGEDALRVRSDEDITRIKEWSRAEIARIKEATEGRIDARKLGLDQELAAHAAAIEGRVNEVEETATTYRAAMEAYAERLTSEEDPARLATMAESMPEPPVLDTLADLGDLAMPAAIDAPTDMTAAMATVDAAEPLTEAVAEVETIDPEAVEGELEIVEPEAVEGELEIVAEPEAVAETVEPEAVAETVEPEAEVASLEAATAPATSAWGEPDAWGVTTAVATAEAATDPEPEALVADAELIGDGSEEWTLDRPVDNVPRWAAGETPDGFPTNDAEAGDPVDRSAIMAALEAAAEAVVAAESAAESADQAEAAADVAETAAELLKGRAGSEDDYDPEAQAALSARVGAGGFEESYTDRLASLMPNHGEGAADGEPRTTQVIVSGLVSVASIASFKRHLGRLSGVQAVAVASGPDGEFVFNVTHRPDVSFRDAVPTMPGFAARVTSTGDGVVQVTARDPEAEG
jgi:hypothetical protein